MHLGGVIAQTKMTTYAPASSIADLNKQQKKGNNFNSNNSGDFSVNMNNQNNNNQNNELIQKVATHCQCPLDIARQALEASNYKASEAVNKIETMKKTRLNNGNNR